MVDKVGDLFYGKEICVIIEDDGQKKSYLEKSIAELGGEPVQNPGKDTFCVVTSRSTHRVKSYAKADLYDIVRVDWLTRCIQDRKVYKWKPKDMIHARLETKNKFKEMYDSYGDSYFEDSTIQSLKEMFSSEGFVKEEFRPRMDEEFKIKLREKIAFLENKHFPDSSAKFGLFRMHSFYLDKCESKSSSLDLIELKIRWHGGVVFDAINEAITHCVLDKKYS